MVTATLTTKGQITIPKSVRDSLRLHCGDRVAFVVHGTTEVMLKPVTKSVDEVYGCLHAPLQPRLSVDEMNETIRKRARGKKQ